MQYVGSLLGYFAVLLRQIPHCLRTILATFLFARHRAMQALDLLQTPLERFGVRNDCAVRECRQCLYSQVNPYHWIVGHGDHLFVMLLLYLY